MARALARSSKHKEEICAKLERRNKFGGNCEASRLNVQAWGEKYEEWWGGELKRDDETGGVCNCSGFNASVIANGTRVEVMAYSKCLLQSRGAKRIVAESISSLVGRFCSLSFPVATGFSPFCHYPRPADF